MWPYVKQGKVKPVVLKSGRWGSKEDVERLMGIVKKREVVLYARVPSDTQKDDLAKQVSYLEERVKE